MRSMASTLLEELPDPPPGRSGWPWTEQSDPLPETQPNGEPWPKISIVTPSYNQGQFIEKTIRSVLLQGYPNLEYRVIDGGSEDETVEILEKYDPWIDEWLSEPDDGQSDAINKGFKRASGGIFAWLNSDDFYLSGALRRVGQAFLSQSETDVLVGEADKVDVNGEVVYTASVPELSHEGFLQWRNGGNFLQPACFFRREAWADCGPLRKDLEYCMDVDLWFKMVEEKQFEGLPEQLARAVQHPGAKTTAETTKTAVEVNLLLAEHGGYAIARRELMEIADEMAELERDREKLARITHHPLYRYVLGPIYRWVRAK